MGTVFAASKESVIHENYKNSILKAKDIDSRVTGRSTGHPIRVLRNDMARKYLELEKSGADGVLLLGDYNETSMIIAQADRIENLSDMQYFMDASILSEVFLERIKDISHEENCIVAASYNPYDDRDLYKEFAQKLQDQFGIATNEPTVFTYDLINIMAQALEKGATREALVETIKGMEFENMLSASGTIKFNADGNREALDIAIISVKDNAFYYTGNSVDMTGAME